jgi:hypothetical protein
LTKIDAHEYYKILTAMWKAFRETVNDKIDKESAATCVIKMTEMAKLQPDTLKPFAYGLCNTMAGELARIIGGDDESRAEAAEAMWKINEPRIRQAVVEALKEGEFLCQKHESK